MRSTPMPAQKANAASLPRSSPRWRFGIVAASLSIIACAPSPDTVSERLQALEDDRFTSAHAPAELAQARRLLEGAAQLTGEARDDQLRAAWRTLRVAERVAAGRRTLVATARAQETARSEAAKAGAEQQRAAMMAKLAAAPGVVALPELPAVEPLAVARRRAAGENLLLADVRPETAFALEHIDGAVSVPLGELAVHRFPAEIDLVVYAGDDAAPELAAALAQLEPFYPRLHRLAGGLAAWRAAALPLVRQKVEAESLVGAIEPAALLPLPAGVVLIDVRPESACASGQLPGARCWPLPRLETAREAPEPLGSGRVVVYGGSDEHARAAAAHVKRLAGSADVSFLSGGAAAWVRAGGLLERAVLANRGGAR